MGGNDHTSDYDPLTAIWVALLGVLALSVVFIVPYWVDDTWYSGSMRARWVRVPVVQGQPVPQAKPAAPTAPLAAPPPSYSQVVASAGGTIIKASTTACPDLSSLRVQ